PDVCSHVKHADVVTHQINSIFEVTVIGKYLLIEVVTLVFVLLHDGHAVRQLITPPAIHHFPVRPLQHHITHELRSTCLVRSRQHHRALHRFVPAQTRFYLSQLDPVSAQFHLPILPT